MPRHILVDKQNAYSYLDETVFHVVGKITPDVEHEVS